MRFEPESIHAANNGLNIARGLMEEIKKEFDWISYGDLWTLAGVAAVQVCDSVLARFSGSLSLSSRKWAVRRSRGVQVALMVLPRMRPRMVVSLMQPRVKTTSAP